MSENTFISIILSDPGSTYKPGISKMAYVVAEYIDSIEESITRYYKSIVTINGKQLFSTEDALTILHRVQRVSNTVNSREDREANVTPNWPFGEYGKLYLVEDDKNVRRHIIVPNGAPLIMPTTDKIIETITLYRKYA